MAHLPHSPAGIPLLEPQALPHPEPRQAVEAALAEVLHLHGLA